MAYHPKYYLHQVLETLTCNQSLSVIIPGSKSQTPVYGTLYDVLKRRIAWPVQLHVTSSAREYCRSEPSVN